MAHYQITLRAVYPRVGGETTWQYSINGFTNGLPPRGRGNRVAYVEAAFYTRSTPAWAGKPMGTSPDSPGKPGLPPRGRGNRNGFPFHVIGSGSTPAWAGKPLTNLRQKSLTRVYPRVGGETLPVPRFCESM